MWPLALASAGGSVIALATWRLLQQFQQQSGKHRLVRRLQQFTQPQFSSTPAIPVRDMRFSYVPMLQRLFAGSAGASSIRLFLQQAGSSLNVSSYVILHLCGAIAGLLIASKLHTPAVFSVLIAGFCAAIPYILMESTRQRRFNRLSEQLPDAIRLMASALRAGLGLDAGMEIVASELPDPIRTEFRTLLNESMLEADMHYAFQRLVQRVPIPSIRLFAASALLHREVGGNYAQLLDQLEETVRERFRLSRELKTVTAESRLTAWVLGALPIVVGFGLFLINHDYLYPLLYTEAGRRMLWGGIGLQVLGVVIIGWLVRPRIH